MADVSSETSLTDRLTLLATESEWVASIEAALNLFERIAESDR